MGSPWKMFTQAQGQQLIDDTNSTWTSINGVNGYKFTSKTDSSKYIFIPAAGFWIDTEYNYPGIYGYYWTTTKKYAPSYATNLSLNSGQTTVTSSIYKYIGSSVRANIFQSSYI